MTTTENQPSVGFLQATAPKPTGQPPQRLLDEQKESASALGEPADSHFAHKFHGAKPTDTAAEANQMSEP